MRLAAHLAAARTHAAGRQGTHLRLLVAGAILEQRLHQAQHLLRLLRVGLRQACSKPGLLHRTASGAGAEA
jgi:hypothetical protein